MSLLCSQKEAGRSDSVEPRPTSCHSIYRDRELESQVEERRRLPPILRCLNNHQRGPALGPHFIEMKIIWAIKAGGRGKGLVPITKFAFNQEANLLPDVAGRRKRSAWVQPDKFHVRSRLIEIGDMLHGNAIPALTRTPFDGRCVKYDWAIHAV